MSVKEKADFMLTKARVKTLMQTPFFGQLLCNLIVEEEESVDTMATDGKKLYYNPEFVVSLDQKELNFVNVHEVLHVALGHIWRKGTRAHSLWNIACDYAINGIIQESIEADAKAASILQLPSCGVLYREDLLGMSAEEIYEKLYKDTTQEDIDEMIEKMLDNHDVWEEAETQSDKDKKESDWSGKLIQASKSVQADKIPAGLKRIIDKLTNPTKNWREEISDFCQPEVNDYSFAPPDRRYGDSDFFLPDFNEPINVAKDVLVVMDTSASITQAQETAFYSETYGAINQFGDKLTGWVMFFDGEPYDPIRFDSAEEMIQIAPKGGGGTDFIKVFNKIRDLIDNGSHNFSGVMFCTDGYDDFPRENPIPEIPLLWVMCSDVVPPFGRHTRLDEKQYD